MHVRRLTVLILAIAVVCAGLGAWLGAAIADDAGSIILVAVSCGILGSFAPVTVRWAAAGARRRDHDPGDPR